MEDAATAEISRTQVWQWIQRGAHLEDGRAITYELYEQLRDEEIEKIKAYIGQENYATGQFAKAIELFDELVGNEAYTEFLTLPAYELITNL
jgi:malate synthase